jgi:hypothetical protein
MREKKALRFGIISSLLLKYPDADGASPGCGIAPKPGVPNLPLSCVREPNCLDQQNES